MEADKNYIFISYSRDDLPKVTPIVEEMRRSGYNVWNDTKILPGEDWSNHIASHIKNCAVCVAFHSQTSRDSPHCREEIHYALKHGKTVISVYLEDVTLKEGLDMQLARFQSIRYAEPAELLEALRKSPDFERCRESVSDTPPKRSSVKTKKIGAALKKSVHFLFRAVSLLVALALLIAILKLLESYVQRTPIWYLDNKSGVLDIISPPFLKVEMPDYRYSSDSRFHYPPPWVAQTQLVQCVIIRKNVTRIGAVSFQNCSNMKCVFISEDVSFIGDEAFADCTGLESVYFPSNVTDFEDEVSLDDTELEVTDVAVIGEKAFSGCISLKQVQFSEHIQEIWAAAFIACTALEEITIPSSMRAIYNDAFSGCSNLKTVHIQFDPEKVQVVENWNFIANPDILYIIATAFEKGTKIIVKSPTSDENVVEYIWGSDYIPFDPDTEIVYEPPVSDTDVSDSD